MNNLTFILRDNRTFETIQIKENLETVGDLNKVLQDKGINTENVQYYEPKSQINQLSSDTDARLVTQNTIEGRNGEKCVILSITTAGKDIDGGLDMTRTEMYSYIVINELEDECKRFNKNHFTNLSNNELLEIIENHSKDVTEDNVEEDDDVEEETEESSSPIEDEIYKALQEKFNLNNCIVSISIVSKDTIEKKEEKEEEEELPFTNEEIDDILNNR